MATAIPSMTLRKNEVRDSSRVWHQSSFQTRPVAYWFPPLTVWPSGADYNIRIRIECTLQYWMACAILLNVLPNMQRHICQKPKLHLTYHLQHIPTFKKIIWSRIGGGSGLQWFISSQESLGNIFQDIMKQISPQNILCGKSLCCTGLPNTLSTAVIWSTATAASRSHSPFLRRSFPKYFTGHRTSLLCIVFPHRDIFSSSIEIKQYQIYSYLFLSSVTNTLIW